MNMDNKKSVAVLGSTGSVGCQALDAAASMGAEIAFIAANTSAGKLAEQVRQYKPTACVIVDERCAAELKAAVADTDTKVYSGRDALVRLTEEGDYDTVIHSIAGSAGIEAAFAAARSGKRIGMANKEAIISAGELIYAEMKRHGTELIPVDSEHSAIFQCLASSGAARTTEPSDGSKVSRILLTASGGPFFGRTRDQLAGVTAEDALAHPTWKMGKKITIDCATLMNKGFEIIEASRLFGVGQEKIKVVIHRQSIIHSMVEYADMTVIAQLATPDMRHPIRYAITYPDRLPVNTPGLDFASLASLTFDKPDTEAFPLLDAARRALSGGDSAPASLIAADEAAVDAFVHGRLSFTGISDAVLETMARVPKIKIDGIDAVFEADRAAREIASGIIGK